MTFGDIKVDVDHTYFVRSPKIQRDPITGVIDISEYASSSPKDTCGRIVEVSIHLVPHPDVPVRFNPVNPKRGMLRVRGELCMSLLSVNPAANKWLAIDEHSNRLWDATITHREVP